jgi:CDP-diacylglycerol--glycerol-3-phosphate 3-phosphatidyltransferase
MNKIIVRNTANFIVLFRILLVFVVTLLLEVDLFLVRLAALFILAVAALLDWFDGYVARRYKIVSRIGGLVDTLGDRITENLLLIYFSYRHLVPVFVSLIFVGRSFLADFIRYLSFRDGIGTFAVNTSRWGRIFVASRLSRSLYLLLKMLVFFLCGIVLTVNSLHQATTFEFSMSLRQVIYFSSLVLVLFNVLRFILLISDSRNILKEEFSK